MSGVNDGGSVHPMCLNSIANDVTTWHEYLAGISLRAHFAGLVLQGLIANGATISPDEDRFGQRICRNAVALADTLIAELNKEPK